ncbi:unnamed protein product [Lactuca virosa]|uniref:Uncharacterized protein n=1 Tax=Lactuca virosa TaxID=75947 RepID=A0AAU9LRS1_9ASTR|nr:unnamed protein product [Lactuca virosa]
MGNKTECTGFLARTTIKPETKARLDKTESIIVRRPSLKWNFHAGARTSMKVDLLQPVRLFVFHFLLPSPSFLALSYLRNHKSLSLLQLVPVRLFGTGQAAHIHEEKNREGVILLKLGKFTTGNWEGL